MTVTLDVEFNPADEDAKRLASELNIHARPFVEKDGFDTVGIFLRQDNGDIAGGVTAYLNWTWLQVSQLWVDESLRGEGYGSQLLNRIEDIGREHGCTQSHLSTFSFQAKAFYEALGYEEFAILEDYPPGHAKHFLKKVL